MTDDKDDLAKTEKLFALLQGTVPDGCQIVEEHVPNLTADQAWTAIRYLGNQYWQVPDFIERCDVCGDLYDSEAEGGRFCLLDEGTVSQSWGFTRLCLACAVRPEVIAICGKYADQLTPIFRKRTAALKRLGKRIRASVTENPE